MMMISSITQEDGKKLVSELESGRIVKELVLRCIVVLCEGMHCLYSVSLNYLDSAEDFLDTGPLMAFSLSSTRA